MVRENGVALLLAITWNTCQPDSGPFITRTIAKFKQLSLKKVTNIDRKANLKNEIVWNNMKILVGKNQFLPKMV